MVGNAVDSTIKIARACQCRRWSFLTVLMTLPEIQLLPYKSSNLGEGTITSIRWKRSAFYKVV